MLTNPHIVAHGHAILIIGFKYRVVADIDVVAQDNVLWMKDHRPRLKDHIRAESSE